MSVRLTAQPTVCPSALSVARNGVSGVAADTPPTVTTQPQTQTVAEGATATFTVSASGSNPKTYQWEISTNNGVDWSEIVGATSTSYTTGALTEAGDSGDQFRCVVTNDFGSDTSDAATLTVIAAPVITDQPDNTSVSVGAEASFTVAATGSGTLTYQWERSTDSGSNWSNISGATSTTYTIAETVEDEDGYQYRCKVTNAGGTTTSSAATLTVTTTSYLLDDYTGATFAYSLRQLRTGVTNVIRVRRSSDSTEQDFTATEITDGTLTTFCGAGDGCIVTFYDQSGNGANATQSTTTLQMHLVTAGVLNTINGEPAAIGDAASYYTATLASSIDTSTLFSSYVAANTTPSTTVSATGGLCTADRTNAFDAVDFGFFRNSANDWPRVFFANGAGTISQFVASPFVYNENLQLHLLRRNSATLRGYRDGALVITSDSVTLSATATRLSLFSRVFGSSSSPLNGDFCEWVLWPTDLEASRTAISSEVATHYGITLS